MAEMTTTPARERPGTMHLADALQYRLPIAGIVSILHRASGALMFVLLPFVIWLFDVSVTSEASYERFTAAYAGGAGFVPAWLVKLATLALLWAYLHHAIAGLRHVWMDVAHAVEKPQGRSSAIFTLVSSLILTAVFGARIFGLY